MNNRLSHPPALRLFFLVGVILISLFTANPQRALADSPAASPPPGKTHKAVFQVTDGDTKKWNLVLVNALNVLEALGRDKVKMEIVVYGPAIDMLRIESEVATRVDEVIESGVRIIACENTMRGQHLTPADMLPNIHYTQAGVVYLMEKQEQGYAYIRP